MRLAFISVFSVISCSILSFRRRPKLSNPFQEPVATRVVFNPLATPFKDSQTVPQIRFLRVRQRTVLQRSRERIEVACERLGIGPVGRARAAMIVGSGLFLVDRLVDERGQDFLLLFRIPNM